MTAITSLITLMKKNRSQLTKLETTSTKRINRIILEFDTLLDVAERVKQEWAERLTAEKALAKEVVVLEREVEKLAQTRDMMQTTNSTKKQDLTIANKTLHSAEMKLSESKKKLKRAESSLRSFEESIQNREADEQARSKELNIVQGDQEDLMVDLDREIASFIDEQEELASKYWALRFLLREEMLSTPEAKIVNALEGKRTSSIEELQTETYLTRYRVEKAVEQLATRGVLKIESDNGSIKVVKHIKIEG